MGSRKKTPSAEQLKHCLTMGIIIKDKRKDEGWSQQQFAAITGVPVSAIRKFEKGNPRATIGHAEDMCAPFNFSFFDLWCEAKKIRGKK